MDQPALYGGLLGSNAATSQPAPQYNAFTGNLNRYGMGPEHSFFGKAGLNSFVPRTATPTAASQPAQSPLLQAYLSSLGVAPESLTPLGRAYYEHKAQASGLPALMYGSGGPGMGSIGANHGLAEPTSPSFGAFAQSALSGVMAMANPSIAGMLSLGYGIRQQQSVLWLLDQRPARLPWPGRLRRQR